VIGAVVNVILSISKIVCGYWGQSQALIADGLHSLSDLASDFVVLYASKHGNKDADDDHPYGHARIETLFTVVLGIFLIIVACGIVIDAANRMIASGALMKPGVLALLVALASVASKEILYQYTARVADKVGSKLLKANAWHHRSDAISSIIVMIGIGGTMMGITYLDAIAAVGMGIMIIRIGWMLCLQSLQELVDTGLSPERVEVIKRTINEVPGVEQLHTLRTRYMGGNALVDVHIQVGPKLSVSEGHYISDKVRAQLIHNIDEVTDVMVHIDPEDDEVHRPSGKLPSREAFLNLMSKRWSNIPQTQYIRKINLHYLDGQIHMELLLPLEKVGSIEQAQKIADEIVRLNDNDEIIADTKVLFI
jgi:cation diffusion facilitator family transporter